MLEFDRTKKPSHGKLAIDSLVFHPKYHELASTEREFWNAQQDRIETPNDLATTDLTQMMGAGFTFTNRLPFGSANRHVYTLQLLAQSLLLRQLVMETNYVVLNPGMFEDEELVGSRSTFIIPEMGTVLDSGNSMQSCVHTCPEVISQSILGDYDGERGTFWYKAGPLYVEHFAPDLERLTRSARSIRILNAEPVLLDTLTPYLATNPSS